jgi:hypothetical protein
VAAVLGRDLAGAGASQIDAVEGVQCTGERG